jgi:beta-lactamase regulating signal transducer with metallopeptidase domain
MNLTNTLGWALIHFLWEGALIAALLAGTLAFLRHAGSRIRYAASCAALALMVVAAAGTFVVLEWTDELATPTPLQSSSTMAAATPDLLASSGSTDSGAASLARRFDNYLPFLVWAWFGCVAALSIRSLGGWAVAERLARRQTWAAEAYWEERFAALAKRLRISKPMRLAVSARAQVPAVVGWLRPVVLMPASVFTGLTPEQVEALLAHELAHVRRHDYLVNLMQTAAETLFFYHPGVWWVSRTIREERENCCDDLAVETCGNRMVYVRALAELEQLRGSSPRLAMAADGGSLLARIQRLLRMKPTASATPAALLAIIGVVICVVAAAAASGLAQRGPQPPDVNEPALERVPVTLAAGQAAPPPPPAPAPAPGSQEPQKAAEKSSTESWLDGIEAAGLRDLNVDDLISLKVHDIDAAYIQQLRAAGFDLSKEELLRFRVHDITPDFINELKKLGLSNLTADDFVRIKIHGGDPSTIGEIRSMGYPNLSSDDLVSLLVHGVSPEMIREAQKRFKNVTIDELVRLKIHGVFD